MSLILLDRFAELLDLALRMPGRLTYDFEAPQETLRKVGPVRTHVFTDGTARDYAKQEPEIARGRLTVRAWAPVRPATCDEKRRLNLKLVDAAVDAKGEPQ
jgi:hypothetical protein